MISFTPVRSLGDCVGSAYALRDERIASHVFRTWWVSPPLTCSLTRDFPNTVGFTPHICKQNRDAPWPVGKIYTYSKDVPTSDKTGYVTPGGVPGAQHG